MGCSHSELVKPLSGGDAAKHDVYNERAGSAASHSASVCTPQQGSSAVPTTYFISPLTTGCNESLGTGGSLAVKQSLCIPPVPPHSWYATPFSDFSAMSVSEFHVKNKGSVVFGCRPIPASVAELNALPQRAPTTVTTVELGKDWVYGMAYLHNTALFIEHYWHMRVQHFLDVKERQLGVSPAEHSTVVSSAPEKLHVKGCVLQDAQTSVNGTPGRRFTHDSDGKKNHPSRSQRDPCADLMNHKGGCLSKLRNPVAGIATSASAHSMQRLESSVYAMPPFDMFIGIKVYVNDVLVPDHYPTGRSLPQCTATIDTSEAVKQWISIPFVLIGYLNHFTLGTIGLYRTLSLSFVEHLLQMKIPTGTESLDVPLRVEVVYGCRAEALFCTDFIARGVCTMRFNNTSKPKLKGYRDKLYSLVGASRESQQIVHARPSALREENRKCAFCALPLNYVCTVCGAAFCGSPSCVWKPLPGYPKACTVHKSQVA